MDFILSKIRKNIEKACLSNSTNNYINYRASSFRILSSMSPKRKQNNGKSLENWNNYCLALSGKSFNIFLNNDYLLSHLIFLIHWSQSIIGFNFTPKDKGIFVKTIKKSFPEKYIFGIGSNINCFNMLKEVDVSAEVVSDLNKNSELTRNFQNFFKKTIFLFHFYYLLKNYKKNLIFKIYNI